MKNLINRVLTGLAAGVLAIATVAAMSTPAQAATDTYTPHGGPAVTFSGLDIAFTDVAAEQTFTCEQSNLAGTVTDPGAGRPFGEQAAALDQSMSSTCFNPIMGETTFAPIGAWKIAVTGPRAGSVWPATLTDVSLFVDMANCSFNIAGTVDGEIDETDGLFRPTGSTLTTIDDPLGFICQIPGFMKGNEFDVVGSWNIAGLSITSP